MATCTDLELFDTVVIGGGPAGATAAWDLACTGKRVMLLDRAGRIKPCGGAIPPRLIKDFDIPSSLIVAEITAARMVAPSKRHVDIPIDDGCVAMVDREHFDPWLRQRASNAGAELRTGTFNRIVRNANEPAIVEYTSSRADCGTTTNRVAAHSIIGADGAISAVAKQEVPKSGRPKYVFAYHEIVRSPQTASAVDATQASFDHKRCDVIYQGATSPDFYSWIFPHGDTTSIGSGSAIKGFSLKEAVRRVRETNGLDTVATLRREGAPIPLKPLRRWDNGRDLVLAGDAAGVVAPASGEGIYYAMLGGRLAAEAVKSFLATGNARDLRQARQHFMRAHGSVFWVLGIMQYFWYRTDRRRERFVSMCRDRDVQKLTFDAYMNKELVRAKPLAHVRIFLKDVAHLVGLARA